jgi:nicotinamidase-related amidase
MSTSNQADIFKHTALILIDIQRAFFESSSYFGSERSNPDFVNTVMSLLAKFRSFQIPAEGSGPLIVHVYHISSNPDSPLYRGKPGVAFVDFAEPREHEPRFSKGVNSAFVGTGLAELLRKRDIRELYVCGLTTEHCVSTSTRMAANLGILDRENGKGELEKGRIVLVDDATAAYNKGDISAELVHKVNVACLDEEFCEAKSATEVMDEMNTRWTAKG